MDAKRDPISRRERPAKPALTRAGIVGTALRILRAEGLAKVTMRRLAQELDTGPASLYVYVANTAELHAAVLDALLGEVDLTGGDVQADWREQLLAVLKSYTDVLFRHPQLARSALVARPSGENYLALVERVLDLLSRGGAAPDQVAWGLDLLLQHATAVAAEHATQEDSPASQDDWNALSRAVHGVDESTHPMIRAHLPALLAGPVDHRLTWGFDVLINGIAGTPLPRRTD
ncbi:TetR/AcrR family transcriptional regulator [Streptomyces galbus]|uniref:TetR family transcriptional regulator n=1 Tax=Streptomyces galbus TaxID=33898 RepID=A0A4U5WZN0_STRGB|nr:TetR/AcrR family transcriptional regulator C-terminal domain-containing protein [Streptomyces galbus]TKT08107.1 TetR family transcriptional regulator [Streptomyces galbus]GHD42824.1 TetR family transcriptional regulator [Streptomyces galbus]